MIATTSLALSKELAGIWPKWAEVSYFISHLQFKGETATNKRIVVSREDTCKEHDHKPVALFTLDELRVFALKRINEKSDQYWISKVGLDKFDLKHPLDQMLVQGCDPTARWIIDTFGEAESTKGFSL